MLTHTWDRDGHELQKETGKRESTHKGDKDFWQQSTDTLAYTNHGKQSKVISFFCALHGGNTILISAFLLSGNEEKSS